MKSSNGCLLAVLAFAVVFSSLASAQATRTWVSGVGDDANPCSRTAPCKTWAGAISKTAPGGEIDALDSGGFGALTITKSITIDGGGGQVASVLVSGTNGMVIAAASNDVVTLRNLRFDGLLGNGSNSANAGLDGVKIISAGSVHLENLEIFGFDQNGVEVAASGNVEVSIDDSRITDTNIAAVAVATSSGIVSVKIRNLHAYNSRPIILGGSNSTITVSDSDFANGLRGIRQDATGSVINLTNCRLANFSVDVLESYPGSIIYASGNIIAANVLGVNPNGGTISSDGTNVPIHNTSNGAFNGTSLAKF